MAELLLSAFLDVLFDRLASPELLKFARLKGLRKQLDKWGKTLTRIREVLDDAEEEQQTQKTVKAWLDDLRDLAYDVEDILDEFATKALQRKLMAGESQASASKVRNLVPACCTSLTPSAVKIKFRLGSKIEEINKRFDDLVTQKDKLNLKENSSPRTNKRRERPPPTSLVTKDHIYGREEIKEAVLQLLVSGKLNDGLKKVPNVIPILGMGGIGKTTLAQLVYNDKEVESFFNLKAWACVSEDFDVATVTKTILQSLSKQELHCADKDLNWLQVELKQKLLGKRFLVILDDVWNENYNDWTRLRAPFEVGAPGSSIIVTTRNQKVSSLMRTKEVEPFQLEELSNEACLSVFTQHALDARDFSAHPELKDIGEELVRRCKGLPLAVKTIAGVLRSEDEDRNEWEKVLKNKIWDISIEGNGIASSLMVSYDNLPSHLKRCFAYCSILPKDYEFKENEVVLLWMAEGLIQSPQDEEEIEDLGSKYFRNLLSRSFFQQSRINESRFVMHDLINDLAQSVAGNTCFRMEDRVGGTQNEDILKKARHSSYLGSQYDATKKFEIFSELKSSLRTFLPLMLPYPGDCYLAHHVSFELVPMLRCLRVLSFKEYYITDLPDSIGDLKHLRYLDLSRTRIRHLPESITSLYNLQTLLLEECHYLKKLPSMFRNLVNLRHLNIEGANRLEGMPMQIGRLTCLQTLSNFVLGKDNCSGIKGLGPLKHLGGRLCIQGLENVIEPNDAKDAELIKKRKISALWLEWSGDNDESGNSSDESGDIDESGNSSDESRDIDESKDTTSELEVLNGLQPPDALKELCITNYGGTKFPNWLTPPSFPHMVSLRLENCYKCTSLPPLGQYLPSLKNLWIEDMKEWEHWSPCEEFPNLRELYLGWCPKLLGKLPNNVPLLNKVTIIDCAQLVVSISCFPDKCKFNIERSEGVVCGGKVTFKSITFDRSLSPISDMEGLAELEFLSIEKCEELTNLWSDNMGSLPHDLPFLRVLNILHCPKLVSLVAEEVDQERLQLRIKSIYIDNCIALESLPKALMYNNTCLHSITIYNCDSLTHFARSHLPPTLKDLIIWKCKSMRNLVEDDDNDINNNNTICSGITSLLEVLEVWDCPSLESLTSSGELPATLQRLKISKSFHHNSSLTDISIAHCENLQLLNGGDQLLLLTSLQYLEIWNCSSILSFPKEGFPTNLTTLVIRAIGGCQNLVFFPEMTLPASLTSLDISKFSNPECLSSEGLRKLTSLKDLTIRDCEKLTFFPEDGLPPSLLELDICNCQKLMSLPKNGLPPSLQKLTIRGCPLLEERCKKDQGGEWRKIADIPCVEINYKYIYDTEEEE